MLALHFLRNEPLSEMFYGEGLPNGRMILAGRKASSVVKLLGTSTAHVIKHALVTLAKKVIASRSDTSSFLCHLEP